MTEQQFVEAFWWLALLVVFLGALCLGAAVRAVWIKLSPTWWATYGRPAAMRRWGEILKGE
jgi:hypothetical protein